MSLTAGTAPFGPQRAGRFDIEVPNRVVHVEPFARRVRAVLNGGTVIDSDDVVLVHETGALPHYAFPAGDVHIGSEREEHVDGHVRVAWDAVDAWYEEDERVEVHPRDPYRRIDVLSTSRRVTVSVDGTVLANSTRALALYETSLPVRYYLPPADVHLDLLHPSATMTECPYNAPTRGPPAIGTPPSTGARSTMSPGNTGPTPDARPNRSRAASHSTPTAWT